MNILLAITGSISAYKMIDLAKELKKQNEVKVIISHSAKNFLNPQIFQYFNIPCFENDFSAPGVLHIELARWAETFVLCPASAHKISVLAHGQCDDLMSSVFLSLKDEVRKIIVPAMNVEMLNNLITRTNIAALQSMTKNTYIIPPDSGMLACGEEGDGKLPTVKTLSEVIPLFSEKRVPRKVVITAGATVVPIDSVRFISNPGKGGTGYLLAKEFLKEGYRVHVIKGVNALEEFEFLKKLPLYSDEVVITTDHLLSAVKNQVLSGFDAYVSPMAVSDLQMANPSSKKLKKKDLENLKITSSPDVLKYVVETRKRNQIIVGFAAESVINEAVIKEKMERKPVDLLVVNAVDSGLLGKESKGFGTRDGEYTLVTQTESKHFPKLTKLDVALKIVSFVNSKLSK